MNPFTEDELFSSVYRNHSGDRECPECGAVVSNTSRHTEWHNKVADL